MIIAATLREVALWWLRQMRSLLPERLLPDAWRGDALVVEVSDPSEKPTVRLTQRRRQREIPLGDFKLDDAGRQAASSVIPRPARRIILRPDPGAVLQRQVTLPLAAEHDLLRVLHYEMDGLTPFKAEHVFWSAITERRNREAGRLELSLLLVPRSLVQSAITVAASIGLSVSAIEATTTAGQLHHIELASSSRPRTRLLPVAWEIAVVLAVAALVTPFVMQSLALHAVDTRIAALQPRIAQVETLRKQIAAGSAGKDIIAAEYAAIGDILQGTGHGDRPAAGRHRAGGPLVAPGKAKHERPIAFRAAADPCHGRRSHPAQSLIRSAGDPHTRWQGGHFRRPGGVNP